ncbi:glycosyltransferase [Helicobacter didelphidarum]|uniref:Glycosyltransferase n=1 Tax=Helicobacter didelphidarum TaxID=2040648 RepID=A0A3D8I806_9HELI|nr:ATP-grasp fold amidoligase family protein [Helicobacter didelphidarum]RDU61303.1 glycosyltransferase [Helicobacter didelphidarum]
MIKTNHDCGGVVIVENKEQFLHNQQVFNEAKNKLTKHLETNYYHISREYHYKDIEPRIFVEEMLGENLQDYRFHSFTHIHSQRDSLYTQDSINKNPTNLDHKDKIDSQKIESYRESMQDSKANLPHTQIGFIQIANHTHTKNTLYDEKWEILPIAYLNMRGEPTNKPTKLPLMLQIAKALAAPLSYVRVDLYSIQNRVYVGELTFTPNGGTARFTPQEWDKNFGDMWAHQSSIESIREQKRDTKSYKGMQ